ncbi:unnamed protein product [Timema podura]|uniref:Uncharacterized protein n=1 Tax=Timema podura TaxID=61482 RepID=A0ABN7NQ03_TIMPD|nr:unnamed protein product [Timema podura]
MSTFSSLVVTTLFSLAKESVIKPSSAIVSVINISLTSIPGQQNKGISYSQIYVGEGTKLRNYLLLRVTAESIGNESFGGQGEAQQVRTVYADWRMIRDLKRRKMVEQYAIERLRINSLRKNDILPPELRPMCADIEVTRACQAMATQSHCLETLCRLQ